MSKTGLVKQFSFLKKTNCMLFLAVYQGALFLWLMGFRVDSYSRKLMNFSGTRNFKKKVRKILLLPFWWWGPR